MTISYSIAVSNKLLAGSRATQKSRRLISVNFASWLVVQGIHLEKIQKAEPQHVLDYLKHRQIGDLANGVKPLSVGSLKNIQSTLNQVVNVHRSKDDPRRIVSSQTEIGARDRRGSKRPPTEAEYQTILANARKTGEEGFVLMLQLERLLGLRAQEALCCVAELTKYLRCNPVIENASMFIHVVDGTKGGRARSTEMIASRTEQTWQIIQLAVNYAQSQDGHLLIGKRAGLKAARNRYQYLCRQVGLVGEVSGHALRYGYAVEKLAELKNLGLTRKEAGQWVARCLGHGASRDRYVRMVYGRASEK